MNVTDLGRLDPKTGRPVNDVSFTQRNITYLKRGEIVTALGPSKHKSIFTGETDEMDDVVIIMTAAGDVGYLHTDELESL